VAPGLDRGRGYPAWGFYRRCRKGQIFAESKLFSGICGNGAGLCRFENDKGAGEKNSITPDWLPGILSGIGAIAGMYLGARCQKYLPAKIIK